MSPLVPYYIESVLLAKNACSQASVCVRCGALILYRMCALTTYHRMCVRTCVCVFGVLKHTHTHTHTRANTHTHTHTHTHTRTHTRTHAHIHTHTGNSVMECIRSLQAVTQPPKPLVPLFQAKQLSHINVSKSANFNGSPCLSLCLARSLSLSYTHTHKHTHTLTHTHRYKQRISHTHTHTHTHTDDDCT